MARDFDNLYHFFFFGLLAAAHSMVRDAYVTPEAITIKTDQLRKIDSIKYQLSRFSHEKYENRKNWAPPLFWFFGACRMSSLRSLI